MSATAELLDKGLAHHQAGRLREAAWLYQELLRVSPLDADALHLLGLVHHQQGQHVVGDANRNALPAIERRLWDQFLLQEQRRYLCQLVRAFSRQLDSKQYAMHADTEDRLSAWLHDAVVSRLAPAGNIYDLRAHSCLGGSEIERICKWQTGRRPS